MPALDDGVSTAFRNLVDDEDKLALRWKVLTKAKDAQAAEHAQLDGGRLSRLENASWRLWFQKRNNLKTVSSRKYLASPSPEVAMRWERWSSDATLLQEYTTNDLGPMSLAKLDLFKRDARQPKSPHTANGTPAEPRSPDQADGGSDDSSICSESTSESLSGEQGAASSIEAAPSTPRSPPKKRKTVRFDESLNRTAFLCDDESERFDAACADELGMLPEHDSSFVNERFLWDSESSDEEDEVADSDEAAMAQLLEEVVKSSAAHSVDADGLPTQSLQRSHGHNHHHHHGQSKQQLHRPQHQNEQPYEDGQPSLLEVLESLSEGSKFELLVLVFEMVAFFRWCLAVSFVNRVV